MINKAYQTYQVDAFTKELFKGNPARVVLDTSSLTDTQMKDIARELNNSETAFVLEAPDEKTTMWKCDIYTDDREIVRDNNDYIIVMTQGTVEFDTPIEDKQSDTLLTALNIGPDEV